MMAWIMGLRIRENLKNTLNCPDKKEGGEYSKKSEKSFVDPTLREKSCYCTINFSKKKICVQIIIYDRIQTLLMFLLFLEKSPILLVIVVMTYIICYIVKGNNICMRERYIIQAT